MRLWIIWNTKLIAFYNKFIVKKIISPVYVYIHIYCFLELWILITVFFQRYCKVKKELTHFQILNFRIYNGTFLIFFPTASKQLFALPVSTLSSPNSLQLHDIISNSYHYKRTVIITISSPRESARLSSSPRKDPFNSLPPLPFLNPITLELAIIYTWNTDSIPQNRVQNSI